MRKGVSRGLAALVMLAAASSAPAAASDPRAVAVVAASKAATGGGAWDRLDGCYEEGTHGDGRVAYRTWFSLRRPGMRMESVRDGATRTIGFNGLGQWQRNESGEVEVRTEPAVLREAVTTFYVSSNGFFFPERFPAELRYVREAAEGGRRFDIVEIVPGGGRPLEYWFDRSTHHLVRIVDPEAPPPARFEADDYRRVGDISVAFRITAYGPDGAVADRGGITSLSCGAIDEALFDPPQAS